MGMNIVKMPGFSNYEVSDPEEGISPITRRYFIENMSEEDLDSIEVTTPEKNEEEKTEEG